MRIIDRTRQALGHNNIVANDRRNRSSIRRIAIHHSVTPSTHTTSNFENFWRNSRGWRLGGYHEVILGNGDVEVNYAPEIISWGVGGHNSDTYNICVVGNFRVNGAQPNAAQRATLQHRLRYNINRLTNVNVDRVLGHDEFPNQATLCPGINMNQVRNELRQQSAPPNQPSTPANSVNTHIVRAGDTLSHIARQHRTTVAELTRLNNIVNPNIIQVGQVLRLPNSATPNSNKHQITRATQGFMTAADAVVGRNPRTTVQPGIYHVFNHAQGMINVTTRQGIPGSWINPNR